MTFQMRKAARKQTGRPGWLNAGDGRTFGCTVVDISDSGAKLAINAGDQIPEAFGLRLSRFGRPRYLCQIVWRRHDAVGVKFASG